MASIDMASTVSWNAASLDDSDPHVEPHLRTTEAGHAGDPRLAVIMPKKERSHGLPTSY